MVANLRGTDKKKVIHIIGNFSADHGGAQKIVASIISNESKNIDQICAHFFENKTAKFEFAGAKKKVVCLNMKRRFSVNNFYIFLNFARGNRDATFHFHSPYVSFFGRLICFFLSIQTVTTIHNTYYSLPYRINEFLFLRLSDRIVASSLQVKEFAKRLGASDKRIDLVENGFDFKRIKNLSKKKSTNDGDFVIGLIGRLHLQKGFDLFLKTLALIPDEERPFVKVVGDGPQKKQLQQIIERYDLSRNVEMMGFRADVLEIIESCNVIAIPSRWEGLPLVVLEAMAMGKPIVSSALPALQEALGEEAIYFDIYDGFSIRKAIYSSRDRTWQIKAGKKLQGIAITRYSAQAMAEKYTKIYQDI